MSSPSAPPSAVGSDSSSGPDSTLGSDSHRRSGSSRAADLSPFADRAFLADVIGGLSKREKSLPCKYLYDEEGSRLFDQICETPEYYPTRTELSIMETHGPQISQQIGPGVMLVEYGSGSSTKTRLLLEQLIDPAAYVPVDISEEHLYRTAEALARDFPAIEILPVAADFTRPFDLPQPTQTPTHTAIYFPGSTIGNYERPLASKILQAVAQRCGSGGGLVIGIDLLKDATVLQRAYNDAAGVTAEFTLNLLHRINRELNADFQINQFEHRAVFNPDQSRIEIYLASLCDQTVEIAGYPIEFQQGECIHTEYSHKYSVESFAQLAADAGLSLHHVWTDDRQYFGVLHFVIEES